MKYQLRLDKNGSGTFGHISNKSTKHRVFEVYQNNGYPFKYANFVKDYKIGDVVEFYIPFDGEYVLDLLRVYKITVQGDLTIIHFERINYSDL